MSRIKTSDGRVSTAVTSKAGYSTKQNSRSTNRSIRGKRNAQADFNQGAAHGSGTTGSGDSTLSIKSGG